MDIQEKPKTLQFHRIFIAVGVALAILASILTGFSILFYAAAKGDYNMVCVPSNGYPAIPRCVSDLNSMNLFEALTGIGFSLMALGLYLNRRIQPILWFLVVVMVMLGLFAFISFL